MKLNLALVWAAAMIAIRAAAQSPVTVTIDTHTPGYLIPADFAGLSFGAISEIPNHGGVSGNLFNPTNTQLITLFRNAGLHHLRMGGTTVEGTNAAIPSHSDIDNLFGFAKAADVKVIYSLRLLNGDPKESAEAAEYVWKHYRQYIDCLAIGNEPDAKRYIYPPFGSGTDRSITNYQTFFAQWKEFATAITNAAPGAVFAGPDSANRSWTALFARDEKDSGIVTLLTQHMYVGGNPYPRLIDNTRSTQTIPASEAIRNMLSREWLANRYPRFYETALAEVARGSIPYRLTEANDYLKGVTNASDAFASALWALDFLHWWAAKGCAGVNFHNTEWLKTDTVYLDSSGNFQIHPKAYGIRAFDVGSKGRVQSLKIYNPDNLNVSAYAVGDGTNLFVTLINKESGEGARDAQLTIVPDGLPSARVAVMFLAATGGARATDGIILGGATITNSALWVGRWTNLGSLSDGRIAVKVPATSAAVVRLSAR